MRTKNFFFPSLTIYLNTTKSICQASGPIPYKDAGFHQGRTRPAGWKLPVGPDAGGWVVRLVHEPTFYRIPASQGT